VIGVFLIECARELPERYSDREILEKTVFAGFIIVIITNLLLQVLRPNKSSSLFVTIILLMLYWSSDICRSFPSG